MVKRILSIKVIRKSFSDKKNQGKKNQVNDAPFKVKRILSIKTIRKSFSDKKKQEKKNQVNDAPLKIYPSPSKMSRFWLSLGPYADFNTLVKELQNPEKNDILTSLEKETALAVIKRGFIYMHIIDTTFI